MNELINITIADEEMPTVSGRELHEKLGIESNYTTWFGRMCEYGFEADKDYIPILENRSDGLPGKPRTDHQITLDMAKQICMIQRSDTGRAFREYFLEVERRWNSPEQVFARALRFAERTIADMTGQVKALEATCAVQSQQIAELQPKASYYDVVLNCKDLLSVSKIAKDYGKSAQWLNEKLHELGVQFKQGDIWLLYQKYAEEGYTSTKTHEHLGSDGANHVKVHTYWTPQGRLFIYDLLKNEGILPVMEREAA